MMKDYIAKDDDGEVVMKYRQNKKPQLENYKIVEVDDVSNHEVTNPLYS